MRRGKLAVIFRWAFAALALAVLVLRVFIDGGTWTTPPLWLLPGAIGVHAALSMVDNARTGYLKSKWERRAKRAQDFQKAASTCAFNVADKCPGLDARRVGVGLYRIKKSLIRRRPAGLVRTERFRFIDHPQSSGIKWKPGKGAVGQAFESKTPVYRDWRPISQKWANKNITQAQLDKMKPETRSGFTLSEFVEMVGKYDEVLAVPVKADVTGAVLGVLAVDIAHSDRSPGELGCRLNTVEIEEILNYAAGLLRDSVSTK